MFDDKSYRTPPEVVGPHKAPHSVEEMNRFFQYQLPYTPPPVVLKRMEEFKQTPPISKTDSDRLFFD